MKIKPFLTWEAMRWFLNLGNGITTLNGTYTVLRTVFQNQLIPSL